ncbi:MAG: addiction module protein [Verrucomicrobiota bacterium]
MTTLALKEMTLAEKLAAMEALWEDLSRTPEAVESPAWHKEVLEQRQNRVAEGKAGYTSWESAKVDLRRQVS